MGEVWPSDPRPGARCQLTAVIRHEGAAYRLILSPLSPSPVSAPPSHCIWTAVTSFFSLHFIACLLLASRCRLMNFPQIARVPPYARDVHDLRSFFLAIRPSNADSDG